MVSPALGVCVNVRELGAGLTNDVERPEGRSTSPLSVNRSEVVHVNVALDLAPEVRCLDIGVRKCKPFQIRASISCLGTSEKRSK